MDKTSPLIVKISRFAKNMIYALRGVSDLPTIYEEHQRSVESFMSAVGGDLDLPSFYGMNEFTEDVNYMEFMEQLYTEVASSIHPERRISICERAGRSKNQVPRCVFPRYLQTHKTITPKSFVSPRRRLLLHYQMHLATLLLQVLSILRRPDQIAPMTLQ